MTVCGKSLSSNCACTLTAAYLQMIKHTLFSSPSPPPPMLRCLHVVLCDNTTIKPKRVKENGINIHTRYLFFIQVHISLYMYILNIYMHTHMTHVHTGAWDIWYSGWAAAERLFSRANISLCTWYMHLYFSQHITYVCFYAHILCVYKYILYVILYVSCTRF